MLRTRWVKGPSHVVVTGKPFDVTVQVADECGRQVTRQVPQLMKDSTLSLCLVMPDGSSVPDGSFHLHQFCDNRKHLKAQSPLDRNGSVTLTMVVIPSKANKTRVRLRSFRILARIRCHPPSLTHGFPSPKGKKSIARKKRSSRLPTESKEEIGFNIETLESCSSLFSLVERPKPPMLSDGALPSWNEEECELTRFPFGQFTVCVLEKHTHRVGGFGSIIWDCALVLAAHMERMGKKAFSGKRVLDVGSGTGFLGLCAALFGAKVTATDVSSMLPLIDLNVKRNASKIQRQGGSIELKTLPWGPPTKDETPGDHLMISAAVPAPDWIFGSEVAYKDDVVKPLLFTLFTMAGTNTQVLLAVRARGGFDIEDFLQEAAKGFVVETVSLQERASKIAEWAGTTHSSGYIPKLLILRRKSEAVSEQIYLS